MYSLANANQVLLSPLQDFGSPLEWYMAPTNLIQFICL